MTMRWYQRLADIPGLNYPGSPRVQRTRLPEHNLKPEIHRSDFGGRRQEYLSWQYRDGTSSSASPAKSWESQPPADATPGAILQHLYEVLELPGEASDYHFAMQGLLRAAVEPAPRTSLGHERDRKALLA